MITHKTTGWTRQPLRFGRWLITPTDGSGQRTVEFLSAGSWQNLANDSRDQIDRDRVVLVEGDPLPEWAIAWLDKENAQACDRGRQALRDMLGQADHDADMRDAWRY